jgi:uncharacterized membrane protein
MPNHPDDADRRRRRERVPGWRRESLRTTLWLVPTVLVVAAVALFVVTYALDKAVAAGDLTLPAFINTGGPDAARSIATAIAAAVITVVGVVFSITIVALTLASTQFGPRMLRTFIRDFGTQLTLGVFVATFVFCILTLGSVSSAPADDFVPHISVSTALALTLVDLGVLIYFINHVAKTIQITEVIASIARDLDRSIDTVTADTRRPLTQPITGPSLTEVRRRLHDDGVEVSATASGYLQAIGHDRLLKIARGSDAVVEIVHRPGHFVVRGRPLAVVWPAAAAPKIRDALARAHVIGPNRTLAQDLQFAIDQLVEIAIRALSPAVNDTFTAITCIDWLGDAMCKLVSSSLPDGIVRDDEGRVRLIEVALTYDRTINRSFDKIRQAGHDMPAILIRQLENLAKIAEHAQTDEPRAVIERQAAMIRRSAFASIPEPNDRDDVEEAYQLVELALRQRLHRDRTAEPSPARHRLRG